MERVFAYEKCLTKTIKGKRSHCDYSTFFTEVCILLFNQLLMLSMRPFAVNL